MNIKMCLPWLLLILSLASVSYVLSDDPNNSNSILETDEELSNSTRKAITKGMILLSLNLNFLLSNSKPRPENILFAPINVVKTLATVLLGAAGETEAELAKALGWVSGTDLLNKLEVVHRILGVLITEMTKYPGTEVGTNLHIAGAMFIKKGYKVHPTFLELARSIYMTEIMDLDFENDRVGATDVVNNWVSSKTNGIIKNLIDEPIDPRTVVLPVGCLYFNGNWETPFNEKFTRSQPFYLSSEGKYSKEKVTVKMMVNTAVVPYYEDRSLGFSSIGLPYKGKGIYMYILLPKPNYNMQKFALELSYTDVEKILTKSNPIETMYVIPKMKLSTKINLSDVTKRLNIKSMFNPVKANFSNLAPGVYFDDIIHQVEIEVNEIGTIAAAATAVTISRGGVNLFRADRPFIFFIYNVNVNVITFWGAINKPIPYE